VSSFLFGLVAIKKEHVCPHFSIKSMLKPEEPKQKIFSDIFKIIPEI